MSAYARHPNTRVFYLVAVLNEPYCICIVMDFSSKQQLHALSLIFFPLAFECVGSCRRKKKLPEKYNDSVSKRCLTKEAVTDHSEMLLFLLQFFILGQVDRCMLLRAKFFQMSPFERLHDVI